MMKHQTLLTIQAKVKLAIFTFLLLFDHGGLWRNPRRGKLKARGNFEVLKRFYIQIYELVFCWVMEKLFYLQHI